MKLLESVLDLLFPPKCPFCGKILDHPGICPVCKSTLPWILEGETLWELPSGVRCAAPLWYEDLARKGLLREQRSLLIRRMEDCCGSSFMASAPRRNLWVR